MTDRLTSRSLRRAPWRAWLVGCLLLSVAWPAIGPMPWLVDFTSDDRSGVARHHDASEIPGSPTHPDDHNCFQ
ncbi:MAG TPA: hypothetical protein VLI21_10235, partial [Casimicrobiaceae bacterium]|nr:hypothetical protein [Casimicrobiaceae bacterium]